ncbi:MAG TPA: SDR family oxidoreductase [Candidatus Saccharimonadales bacterium]|nr:SDR family oxidoreductase [Candidatus Saccharimonadales bacterium]
MKSVLITGSSSGFGFLTALKFARNGYKVFASVRETNSEGSQKLTQIRDTENLALQIIQIDVTDQESIDREIQKFKDRGENIDILINNAGYGISGPVEEFTIEEIKAEYNTNIFGVVRMIKSVAPIMREHKSGTIVNISSVSGLVVFPMHSVYSSSKYALEALSDGWAFELSHFGIKVVIIEPGSFATDFSKNRKYPAAFNTPNSVYKELAANYFSRYNKTHDTSKTALTSKVLDPAPVVDTIFKAATAKNPAPRYIVGNDAKLYSTIHKLVPDKLWNFILHKAYKW